MDGDTKVNVVISDRGEQVTLTGHGNGPIAAFCDALSNHDVPVRVHDYHEHALSSGGDAKAASYLECAVNGRVLWRRHRLVNRDVESESRRQRTQPCRSRRSRRVIHQGLRRTADLERTAQP